MGFRDDAVFFAALVRRVCIRPDSDDMARLLPARLRVVWCHSHSGHDNAKCAITRACVRDPVVQRAYAECAEGYGFKIDPCPPTDPAKTGVVESRVKYVKGNFLPTRTFRDMTDLNEQARRWILEEAGVRIHGTTRQQSLERFLLEKPLIRRLPDVAPDPGDWHRLKLHRDCHVKLDHVLYSGILRISRTLYRARKSKPGVASCPSQCHYTAGKPSVLIPNLVQRNFDVSRPKTSSG
jgi:hypothetical protein